MLDLRTPVIAYVAAPVSDPDAPADRKIQPHHGVIVGKTYEERPRYDVRLDNGRICPGLAEEWIREDA